jgi:hypothetical protein
MIRTKLKFWLEKQPFLFIKEKFLSFDKKLDGHITFFFKHYGKTKFMMAMSKKAQYFGLEKLFVKGPKAFVYFFMFYLIRDTILYIIIPIYFASLMEK